MIISAVCKMLTWIFSYSKGWYADSECQANTWMDLKAVVRRSRRKLSQVTWSALPPSSSLFMWPYRVGTWQVRDFLRHWAWSTWEEQDRGWEIVGGFPLVWFGIVWFGLVLCIDWNRSWKHVIMITGAGQCYTLQPDTVNLRLCEDFSTRWT